MGHDYISKKISRGKYLVVGTFLSDDHTWCAYESHTNYKPSREHVESLDQIGRPMALIELFEAWPKNRPLGLVGTLQYHVQPDNVLLSHSTH